MRGVAIERGDVLASWFDEGAGKSGGPTLVYCRVLKVGRKRLWVRPEGGDAARWVHSHFFDHKCTDTEIVAEVCAKVPL